MKTLESIQKSCKAFKTLAKIAMILSFIWAGTILAGLLCGIAWRTGGSIMGVSVENALELIWLALISILHPLIVTALPKPKDRKKMINMV